MRVPRDINAERLTAALKRLGYVVIRQTGSHIRLSKKSDEGEHNITVPNHKPVKIGTLQAVASEVCRFNKVNLSWFYGEL
ncbi:MAG: type II toxin-antitoxin system HicA family toxin [Defluviitaleaceae bacterium]|nr:type II toxin-antitoxin system HicA family toxin [Defluviitaleaceae bacterium]